MTIARDIARALGSAVSNNNVKSDGSFGSTNVNVYTTIDDVPLTGNLTGSYAFVDSGEQADRLYAWSGNGWRSVGLGSILSD